MRVAAIDLGTNSTRLLVADVVDGRIAEVVRRLAITRLGEGVDVNHELLPASIARVDAVLDGYAREATELGASMHSRSRRAPCATGRTAARF
jgi:exopolyphosphatase/guanosine-5'-triphosphate,3'-diphosphate pyrophosphatase